MLRRCAPHLQDGSNPTYAVGPVNLTQPRRLGRWDGVDCYSGYSERTTAAMEIANAAGLVGLKRNSLDINRHE